MVYPATAQRDESPILYAKPVIPSKSQALRPETTAESATTKRPICLPPRKNSETPREENRVEYTPIPTTRTKYRINGIIIAKSIGVRPGILEPGDC